MTWPELEQRAPVLRNRALGGDDEALEALHHESKVLMLAWAFSINLPADAQSIIGAIDGAILEAVVLWQPLRQTFGEALLARGKVRLEGLFLAEQALMAGIQEVTA